MTRVFHGTYTMEMKITFTKPEVFDEAFFEQFSKTINAIDTLDELAEYITHNYGYNEIDGFLEGVGDLKELGVEIKMTNQNSEVEEWRN